MENLKELSQIVKNIRIDLSDVINSKGSKESASSIFLEKITSGEFASDEDASKFLFDSNPSNPSYKNLKYNLKKRLVNSVYFIDRKSSYSDYENGYLYCCKQLFAAKILLFLQAKNVGISIYQKVFKKALEYNISEFLVDSSRHLRHHFGSRVGNHDSFIYYNKIYKENLLLLQAECTFEEYHSIFILPYINKKNQAVEQKRNIVSIYDEISLTLEEQYSPYLYFLGNHIQIMILMSNNDFSKSIEKCEKVIAHFESNSFSYNTPIRVLLHNQVICYINQKKYLEGKKALGRSNSYSRKGTDNWFINQELGILLGLASKEYNSAGINLALGVRHPKFKRLSITSKERWLLYEAYTHFLILVDKIDPEHKVKKQFKLGKFLNSFPTFSRDKEGINLTILIAQMLFFLIRKENGNIIERIETIEKYRLRYLRKDSDNRNNNFIKMILKIPICNFDKKIIRNETKELYQNLTTMPFKYHNRGSELEIIPYEDLWEIILSILK